MDSRLFNYFIITTTFLLARVLARPAPDGNSLLFFKPVSGGEKAVAANAGFTVVELDDTQWAALLPSDVATYKAVVLGDPWCSYSSPAVLAPVEANRAVWSGAITGNVVIIGTDPALHESISGARTLMDSAIRFAAADKGKTGLYFSLSCYYEFSPETTITLLDQFGTFRVRGNLNCYNKAHIVAVHPAIATLTDNDLSNWSCSVHEIISEYPTNFAPLAIAQDITGPGAREFSDGTKGVPYIVARGVEIIKCGNGKLDPGEECDDGNRIDGDGCSSTCRKEPKGGKPSGCTRCSPHPGENKCHITTSCSSTPYGTMCVCRPGFKAAGAPGDTSLHWRLKWNKPGHEHRVYVRPGEPCNEKCDKWYLGADGCAEITETECK
ncbi:hypothetical protein BDZ91DRAFT_768147 [Kalaharituber pfeilii]|nr:hypothetical protein BDZ91DRAFT_768147 [Kalaharituber pfeilii]